MNNQCNLEAYEGVEYLQCNGLTEDECVAYMEKKMESADSDLFYIENILLEKNQKVDVCEIGCGNGKLLYSLEKSDRINSRAVGYEVSKSRCEMAMRMGNHFGSKKVEIRCENFLDDLTDTKYDLIILVDIVFQMIVTLDDDSEEKAFKWIFDSLKPNGIVMFEIEDFSNTMEMIKQNGEYKKWDEFPKEDPYSYGLYRMSLDGQKNVVYEKYFLRRDGGGKEYNCIVLKSYTRKEMIDILKEHGFSAEVDDYYNSDEEKQADVQTGMYRDGIFRVKAKKCID